MTESDVLSRLAAMTTLVVEDNPMDARMIRLAFERELLECYIIVADDGEKAFHYLLQEPPYSDAVRPDLLILDLNLPKRTGSEVLRLVRTTQGLETLPVVILSSSPEDIIQEIVNRTRMRADLLLTKPSDLNEYLALGKVFRKLLEGPGKAAENGAQGGAAGAE